MKKTVKIYFLACSSYKWYQIKSYSPISKLLNQEWEMALQLAIGIYMSCNLLLICQQGRIQELEKGG